MTHEKILERLAKLRRDLENFEVEGSDVPPSAPESSLVGETYSYYACPFHPDTPLAHTWINVSTRYMAPMHKDNGGK